MEECEDGGRGRPFVGNKIDEEVIDVNGRAIELDRHVVIRLWISTRRGVIRRIVPCLVSDHTQLNLATSVCRKKIAPRALRTQLPFVIGKVYGFLTSCAITELVIDGTIGEEGDSSCSVYEEKVRKMG